MENSIYECIIDWESVHERNRYLLSVYPRKELIQKYGIYWNRKQLADFEKWLEEENKDE